MLNTNFAPWPCYTKEEADKVSEVLLSNRVNYWTGTEGKLFEQEYADWVGVDHAVAVANGTLALELALKGVGIEAGDEVIVPPRTFLATASAVVAVGATPVFADIDADTQNLSSIAVCDAISEKTKAIICVHLAGMPCDMDKFMELAELNNLYVIEDCAQAHGAVYKGRSVGSIGHVGAWSFCQDKIMTTGGEGGMVTTNDKTLWERMWSYKDHGKSFSTVFEKTHPPGFRWLHESFGSNYRMTEMQAAVGRIQLKRMTDWTDRRNEHAEKLTSVCKKIQGLHVIDVPKDIRHAYYKFYAFVHPDQFVNGFNRDRFVEEIVTRGVPCYQGSCSEIYLEKAFDEIPSKPKESLPVAKELGDTSLMFLVHPTLSDQDIEKTCHVIQDVAKIAFLTN